MHLLTCMKMFKASPFTRFLCLCAQVGLTPFLMAVYIIKPKALHRFVGYLEQTACKTYHNIIVHVETPGTHLHTAWAHLPAPDIAKGYWHLADDAKWVDALKCIYADEANHRCAAAALSHTDGPGPRAHAGPLACRAPASRPNSDCARGDLLRCVACARHCALTDDPDPDPDHALPTTAPCPRAPPLLPRPQGCEPHVRIDGGG
jgi:hypothetical protein